VAPLIRLGYAPMPLLLHPTKCNNNQNQIAIQPNDRTTPNEMTVRGHERRHISMVLILGSVCFASPMSNCSYRAVSNVTHGTVWLLCFALLTDDLGRAGLAHQARTADDISGKDGCESARLSHRRPCHKPDCPFTAVQPIQKLLW
jgi:hypothetical protein